MQTHISNRDLVRSGKAIFNNTGSFAFKSAFANREESRDLAKRALEGKVGVLAISDLLGSGKTFLMDQIRNEFQYPGGTEPVVVSSGRLEEEIRERLAESPPFVVIEEVDNKTDRSKVVASLGLIRALISEAGPNGPPVVLIGDRTLDSPQILSVFKGLTWQKAPMEPLTREFFLDAIQKRMAECLGKKLAIEEGYGMFEGTLLARLIPHIGFSSAVFRESLKILQDLVSEHLPGSDRPVFMGVKNFRSWWKRNPSIRRCRQRHPDLTKRFLEWVGSRPWSSGDGEAVPISWSELGSVVGLNGSQETVAERVVTPLVRASLLRYYGIPYEVSTARYARLAGPYLPGPVAFLGSFLEQC